MAAEPALSAGAGLVELAARLAGCAPAAVLACRRRPDGALVVVVWPGPKYVFEQALVEVAAATTAAAAIEVRVALRGPLSDAVLSVSKESVAAASARVGKRPARKGRP